MGINDVEDKTDSEESEINEEKKATRAKKKAVNKKTLVKQRAQLDDYLWRAFNESGCIRTIILKAFDEPDLSSAPRRWYKPGCCSRCSPNERGSTTRINTCRQPRPPKPRAKAPPHVRKAVEAALITWRAEKEAIKF